MNKYLQSKKKILWNIKQKSLVADIFKHLPYQTMLLLYINKQKYFFTTEKLL